MRDQGRRKQRRRTGKSPKRGEEKRGAGWLRSWLRRQEVRGEGGLEGKAKEELLEAVDPDRLPGWLPRLFAEGSASERRRILQWIVPIAGDGAGPFLEEVLSSSRSRLGEKSEALARLKDLGRAPDPDLEEEIGRAVAFVDGFEVLDASAGSGARLRAFETFADPMQGVVLRALMERPSAGLFSFLEGLLEGRPDLWDEVLDSLQGVPGEEAARLLEQGYARGDKSLRKRIRRVQHARKVRGLPVPKLDRGEPGRAVWRPPTPRESEGFLSLPDAVGTKMVWVIRPSVGKGSVVFGAWIDAEGRLLKFFVLDPSRKELERYKALLLENPDLPVVPCDAVYCTYLIDEAYQRGELLEPEEGELYKTFRPLLKAVMTGPRPRAPIHEMLHPGDSEVEGTDPLGESEGILKEWSLAGWAMDARRVASYVEKLEEIVESRLIVHPLQKEERIDAFLRDTTREIFGDPACRETWRRRLEDAAWVLYKKGDEGLAARLAGLARYLEDPERDASRISFFVALVRRPLEEALEKKNEEARESPPLIVKPT